MHELLRSARLGLRLLEQDDLQFRVNLINDPNVQATLNFDYPTSISRTKHWFNRVVAEPSRRDFTIFEIHENEPIGFGGLIGIDPVVRQAELYIFIGKPFWGDGYGTEAWDLITKYGFLELGLNKIYAYQLLENEGSQRITEKLGWHREGHLRKDVFSHGRLHDRYIVSILREEWQKIFESTHSE